MFEHYLPLIDIIWEENSERVGSRDSMSYKTYVHVLRESNLLSASFTTREGKLILLLIAIDNSVLLSNVVFLSE